MTENVGDSGLRFEIWFRRRKSQDTFILQASTAEVKAVWTAIIGKILWRQALRNRGLAHWDFTCIKWWFLLLNFLIACFSALRMQEMVSMGIGSKPFMDIKPSDAAISDRAIDYIMKGTGELLFHFRFDQGRLTLPVPGNPSSSLLLTLMQERAFCYFPGMPWDESIFPTTDIFYPERSEAPLSRYIIRRY